MPADTFEKAYKRLNAEQKEAVDNIEGPVMVIAGPGTGKTQVLTLRIANILRQTDTSPDSILALTFTESAVIAMRRRLAELIGSPAYAVRIATFHSFCNDIIHSYPEAFPRIIGATPIAEVEQIEMLDEIIHGLTLNDLKPFGDPSFYVRPALRGIRKLKQEGISPDKFAEILVRERATFDDIPDKVHEKGRYKGRMKGVHKIAEKRIAKAEELLALYREYVSALERERLYDYEDMIGEVVQALIAEEDILLVLQEQYQYLLVDEHQDTNNAQNKLLEMLASFHKNPNLFVVGDTKQAIFRFQGASLENFQYFSKQYKEAELVVLTKNYRSTQPILDAADSLLPGSEPLLAEVSHVPKTVSVASFSNPDSETYGISRHVKQLIEEGIEPRSIAVLYRGNRDAFPIAAMLERMNIPFQIESDQDILTDSEIRKFIILLRTVSDFGNEGAFIEALHIDFLEIHPLDIAKLASARERGRYALFSLLKSKEALKNLDLESSDAMNLLYRKVAGWSRMARNKPLPEVIEILIRESGFLSHIVGLDDPAEQLDRLQGFFKEVTALVERRRDATLIDFVGYLETLQAHKILVRASRVGMLSNRVRLMTAHRSKGLEFDFVIITSVADGHWGNKRRSDVLPLPAAVYRLTSEKIEESSDLEDERRLFYVALTRARKSVLVTYSKESANGREQLPSVFLEEIGKDVLEEWDTSSLEKDFLQERDIVFAPRLRSGADLRDESFIKELFSSRGLSVTALNNYLICPWRYFYRNLLRVPEAPGRHQMYGIAIHAALRRLFDALSDTSRQKPPDKGFLLTTFNSELLRQPLSGGDLEAMQKRGDEALSGYVDMYENGWHTLTRNEFSISGVLLDEDIRLTGKLDKLELYEDGAVTVVDYKTGKARSRNDIEGKTKASNGDLKRQLVFYKLLLNKYEEGKYNMRDGVIDFVEPDKSGKYRQERFGITDAEVLDLESEVRRVAKEIVTVSFWDSRCDDADCRYCSLREMLG